MMALKEVDLGYFTFLIHYKFPCTKHRQEKSSNWLFCFIYGQALSLQTETAVPNSSFLSPVVPLSREVCSFFSQDPSVANQPPQMTNRQIKLSPKNKISESSLPLPKEKLLLTYPSSILVNDDLLFLSSLKSNKKDKVNK